ncbi:hypothetical protein ACFL2Q_10790 [Thermodesulfobacteriota bacterium]
MKNTELFYNPFRMISPKLDAEASRIDETIESREHEMTCLEEGLVIMVDKLIVMSDLIRKSLILADPEKVKECERLAKEVHEEEQTLTGDLVCDPVRTSGDLLKAVVLFPGRLERVGDLLESILNVARIKSRDGIVFSDMAQQEMDKMFTLLGEVFRNFRDALMTQNKTLLDHILEQAGQLAQMTTDYALAHEERLVQGLCSHKSSSLYLDILDSVKRAKGNVREMSEKLLEISSQHEE